MEPTSTNGNDFPESAGVYLLKHRVTGDTYVGSSSNLRHRLGLWFSNLKSGKLSKRLHEFREANGSDFEASILEAVAVSERFAAERRWIEEIKPTLNTKGVVKTVMGRRCAETKLSVNVRIPRSLLAQLDAFVSQQPYPVERSAVIIPVLREFLGDRRKR